MRFLTYSGATPHPLAASAGDSRRGPSCCWASGWGVGRVSFPGGGAVWCLARGGGGESLSRRGRGTENGKRPRAPAPAAATKPVASSKVGTLALTTQPAGARVLLDGKPVGETPLTLADLPPGK